jgi:hypothetical protein
VGVTAGSREVLARKPVTRDDDHCGGDGDGGGGGDDDDKLL